MQLPNDFITKYTALLGEKEAPAFLKSFSAPVQHGFRVNPLKQLPTGVSLEVPAPHCPFGYYGEVSGKTVAHQSGAVYSQEPSAMYVGEVAHPELNETVLDLCAAPGGKTTHLGSFMQNTGLLVANEIDAKRSRVLMENVERFGLTNTVVTNTSPDVIAKQLPNFFDRVLVDAPCSGEGMFRKDPDAMTYWNLDYPKECAQRQRQILTEAVKTLKPGGTLVYSTCTFAPEEDEQIIAWLVETFHFEIQPIRKFAGMDNGRPEWADGLPELANCVRLFPHHFNGEGHFIAKLIKPAATDSKTVQGTSHGRAKKRTNSTNRLTGLSTEQRQLWQAFSKTVFKPSVTFNQLKTFKDTLYAVPEQTPDFGKIKLVREGLPLGTFKKNRFEPSYALALALRPEAVNQPLEIDQADWRRVVHGDTFTVASDIKKGWYLLVCEGQSVAFSKVVNGTAKNFFPKGLRFQVN